jgi:hypothetical protein
MTNKDKVLRIINTAGNGILASDVAKKAGIKVKNLYGVIYTLNHEDKAGIVSKDGMYFSNTASKEKSIVPAPNDGSITDEIATKTIIRKIAGLSEQDQAACLNAMKLSIFHRLEMEAILKSNDIIRQVIIEMGK